MDAAYQNCPDWKDDSHLFSSKTGNKTMLDDILHHVGGLDVEAVHETLSARHRNFRKFLRQLRFCAREVLFATECGFVGWAAYDLRQSAGNVTPISDHSVLKNDIIVVPRGASMPWVLRETDLEGEYKLIVDCFVQGIMEGELMALVESGQLQTQSFTIV
jgi:hypothetical protein